MSLDVRSATLRSATISVCLCLLAVQPVLSIDEQKDGGQAKNAQSSATGKNPAERNAAEKNGSPILVRSMTQSSPASIKEDFVVGKVKSVSDATVNSQILSGSGMVTRTQKVDVEVLEGPLKGVTVPVLNELTDNPSFNISVQEGKEVILSVVADGKAMEFNIADYHRAPTLAILGLVFLAAFLYFGGKSAVKSLLGLLAAIGLIGFVLLPLSLKGFNPLISAALICFAASCVTVWAIAGRSKKSLAALLGTFGGVVVSGIAAQLVIVSAPLTGLSSEEAQILRANMTGQSPVFFSGLLAASMLIGALGVIMDVGISIASAVWELSQTDPGLCARQLYEKGMNVGRDIMGSMTCTLVLAYSGSALPLLLLMSTMPSMKLVNLDLVASEIAAALTGSLGLVCTIPLTALAASRLMAHGGGAAAAVDKSNSKDPFAEFDKSSV